MDLEKTEPGENAGKLQKLQEVTPLSKYVALALFATMPFIGGYIGYKYAPEKIIEVERVVVVGQEAGDKAQPDVLGTTTATTTDNYEFVDWGDFPVLNKPILIYANKKGRTASVYSQHIKSAKPKLLFKYDEQLSADDSGNFWTGSPPSVDLSPDRKSLAFADADGLHIRNLETDETETIYTRDRVVADCNPMDSTAVSSPRWSADGKYIGAYLIPSEGIFTMVIDAQSGSRTNIKRLTGPVWSPIGNAFAVRGAGDYSYGGLFVSDSATKESQDITPNISGLTDQTLFTHANFSPDGSRIVFTYYNDFLGGYEIALSDTDGKNFSILKTTPDKAISLPIFAPSGYEIWYTQTDIEGKNSLFKYDLNQQADYKVIELPTDIENWQEIKWIDDNVLALVGESSKKYDLLLIDVEKQKLARKESGEFYKFIGVSKSELSNNPDYVGKYQKKEEAATENRHCPPKPARG